MSRLETIVVALSVLVVFSSAAAQGPPPGASAPEPGVTAAQQAAAPIRANRDASTAADARRCLEFATNLEIIKCAEKYLQRRRNG